MDSILSMSVISHGPPALNKRKTSNNDKIDDDDNMHGGGECLSGTASSYRVHINDDGAGLEYLRLRQGGSTSEGTICWII